MPRRLRWDGVAADRVGYEVLHVLVALDEVAAARVRQQRAHHQLAHARHAAQHLLELPHPPRLHVLQHLDADPALSIGAQQ